MASVPSPLTFCSVSPPSPFPLLGVSQLTVGNRTSAPSAQPQKLEPTVDSKRLDLAGTSHVGRDMMRYRELLHCLLYITFACGSLANHAETPHHRKTPLPRGRRLGIQGGRKTGICRHEPGSSSGAPGGPARCRRCLAHPGPAHRTLQWENLGVYRGKVGSTCGGRMSPWEDPIFRHGAQIGRRSGAAGAVSLHSLSPIVL